MSGTEVVYRIAGFPAGASKPATKAILEEVFGSNIEIIVRSVGIHPLAVSAVVATVIFSPVPSQLKGNSKSRISEVVRFNDQPLQLQLEIDTDFLGFTPLNVVDDSQPGQIDCILVSGLSSHAYGSWKERGGRFMWPVDTEDSRPPNVRFLLWGYDTSLINSESFQDIEDIGGTLATALEGIHPSFARDEEDDEKLKFEARPIVFIAHSLGGLIVKEAICQMAQDLAYLRCVYGLVLFGVPHNGLLVDPWLRIIGQRANADLIRSLKPESRDLQRLDKTFRKTFRLPDARVISVYETMKSSTTKEVSPGVFRRSGDSEILVSRSSACGRWPDGIVPKEFPLNRTHEDLPKFKGSFDDDMMRLRPSLDRIWAKAYDVVQKRFGAAERSRLAGKEHISNGPEVQQRTGLIQIWPDTWSHGAGTSDTDLDVIAIHGLGGHSHGSWTAGGRNWLQEFLPFDVPGIRVWTFAYNAVLAFSGSRSSFREISQNLLDDISRIRKGYQDLSDRKIVFICHSLGGLILKQALLLANKLRSQLSMTTDNVLGVLFLGTPNKGDQVAYWRHLFSNIVELEKLPDLDVTSSETMLSISADLGRTCTEFNDQIARRLQIFSLCEQLESEEIESLVVDQASSILRLPTETILALDSDHKGLSRFLTKSSAVYRTICQSISDLIQTQHSSSIYTDASLDLRVFLKLLNAVDDAMIFDPSDTTLSGSTRWIIDHADFKTWYGGRQNRVFWLHGPPGSGKTVLMKSMVSFLTQRHESPRIGIIYKPIHFFFDIKDPQRNSSMAFIRSVLAQILQDKSTRFVFKYLDRLGHDNKIKSWENEDELWTYLFDIVRKSRGIVFQLAIDALDEALRSSSPGSPTIVDRLEELLSIDVCGRVRLLISHREKRLSSDIVEQDTVKVGTQNRFTESSVHGFIRLKVGSILKGTGLPTGAGESIEKKIVEVSQGNYLHATLLWQQFAQGVQTWTIDKILLGLRRLDTLSYDLISSYCRLLHGIDQSYRNRARTAFAILGVCREKLTLQQLAFLANLYETIRWIDNVQKLPGNTVPDLMRECTDLETFLTESCGYLIKKAEDGTVDFAHTSAKDLFTEKQSGIPSETALTLSEYTMSSEDAHSIMRRLCSAILHLEIENQSLWIQMITRTMTTMEEEKKERIQEWLLKKLEWIKDKKDIKWASVIGNIAYEKQSEDPPVIQRSLIESMSRTPCFVYSIFHWFEHYQASPPSRDSDQKLVNTMVSRVGQVIHMLWVFMTRSTVPHYDWSQTQSLRPTREVCLYRIITRGDHPALVKALIEQGVNLNHLTSFYMEDDRPEEHGISPLSWSIVCQRRQTLDLFLRNETIQVNRGLRMTPKPLHFAVWTGDSYYIERIVQHPDCNVNVTDHKGTPLHLALYRMNFKAVEVILDQEYVDVWIKDHHGESAYERAFSRGMWGSMFEKLLQASKKDTREVLAEPIQGTTQLSMASTHGWTNVEEVILRDDLEQLFRVDSHTGMSPLISPAYFGRKEKLLWILDRVPPDVPLRRDSDQFDLLHLCADQDWEDVVHLLQRKYGIKSLASDHKGRTLLHWAVEYGWDMDHFSLSNEKDVLDRPDRDGLTVLHLAILTRDMKVLRALIAAGADCSMKDKNGMTPAHLAADIGFREALDLFIDMPTREFGRTRTGASLLHLMASWFDGPIVRKLVTSKRALLDVVDKKRNTPLHFAAMVNNMSSVDALVAMGCNINARNSSRCTPLHEAIRGRSVGTALLLLKLGADHTAVDAFGQTCLLMAYRYGLDSLVPRFLRLKCSIHAEDAFMMTPLHRACATGNQLLVLDLLNRGANWRLKNKYRRTPLDLAVKNRNLEAVKEMVSFLWQNHRKSKTRQRVFNRSLRVAIQEECGRPIELVLEKHKAKADRDSIVVRRVYNAGVSPQPGVLPLCVYDRRRNYPRYFNEAYQHSWRDR